MRVLPIPTYPSRVFEWLLEEERDELGNVIAYEYAPEDRVGVDPTVGFERHRADAGQQVTSRHIHVEALHIDTAARSADINGTRLDLGRKEFELLATLASDPTKVFGKDELTRRVWGQKTRLRAHAPSSRTSCDCASACTTPAPCSSTTAEAPAGHCTAPAEPPARTPRSPRGAPRCPSASSEHELRRRIGGGQRPNQRGVLGWLSHDAQEAVAAAATVRLEGLERLVGCADALTRLVERTTPGGVGRCADPEGVAVLGRERDFDDLKILGRLEHRPVGASAAT